MKAPVNQTCLSCHPEIAERIKDVAVHGALLTGDGCANCHDPHAADQPGLAKALTVTREDASYQVPVAVVTPLSSVIRPPLAGVATAVRRNCFFQFQVSEESSPILNDVEVVRPLAATEPLPVHPVAIKRVVPVVSTSGEPPIEAWTSVCVV